MRLRPLLAAIALAALAFVTPAAQADPVAVMPCQITAANIPVYCPSHTLGGGVVYGTYNNSPYSQMAIVLCYGSTNQNVAAGPIVFSIAPLGPSQSFNVAGGGKLYTGYLVCEANAAITGTDIDVYVY